MAKNAANAMKKSTNGGAMKKDAGAAPMKGEAAMKKSGGGKGGGMKSMKGNGMKVGGMRKKRGMKKSKIAKKSQSGKFCYLYVFKGWYGKEKTVGGLTKDDLMKNDRGKVVSREKHNLGLAREANTHNLLRWRQSVEQAKHNKLSAVDRARKFWLIMKNPPGKSKYEPPDCRKSKLVYDEARRIYDLFKTDKGGNTQAARVLLYRFSCRVSLFVFDSI